MNNQIKITKGPAAANIYLSDSSYHTIAHLLLDWSYDSIDFKYKNEQWITINKNLDELKIDPDKIKIFKLLAENACINLKGYSNIADKTLKNLNDLILNLSE